MDVGQINVESVYGEGSEFFEKLPVKIVAINNQEIIGLKSIHHDEVERINIEFSYIYPS